MDPMNFKDAYRMLNQVWKLYRKFVARNLTDAEIDAFAKEMDKIYKENNTPFAKDISLAFINEVERNVKFFRKGQKC